MNSFDQQFLLGQDTYKNFIYEDPFISYIQFDVNLQFIKQKAKTFTQKLTKIGQVNVYVQNDYVIATQGQYIIKAAYFDCSQLEFILELKVSQFLQNGCSPSDIIKLIGISNATHCAENFDIFQKFRKIFASTWQTNQIQRLNASTLIYNFLIQSNQFDSNNIQNLYCRLLNNAYNIKMANTYPKKVRLMKKDCEIFNMIENQHFPGKMKNCDKCKVCQFNLSSRKSKFYCKACYRATGRKWCLCLDPCFNLFHQNPSRYLNRKHICKQK